uniref:GM25129p n=1 Tax=Drosophila melanogaster TaxID=7227 RepID=C4XVG0_DROME|nr:GM25129p [Drosophila melanogaster]
MNVPENICSSENTITMTSGLMATRWQHSWKMFSFVLVVTRSLASLCFISFSSFCALISLPRRNERACSARFSWPLRSSQAGVSGINEIDTMDSRGSTLAHHATLRQYIMEPRE